ncbi:MULTISPECIES: chloride channel protein [Paraburkholderia]|uniref:chloride channel protein n=1 Tax=Paraburkholderia TaxID=1822464 RepID=UPI00224E5602|nr:MULTISPECIES: chloride channel protein [Paraburkholderia]MCX4159662.1 chloride channel protein [Paraburkholderia aspalathi]MDN7169060.1 chloride channel protein [Paraburkholderia sp. SECH2]MDQ6397547.1 chloride channel protein [Paraburkholderia aspalathi]
MKPTFTKDRIPDRSPFTALVAVTVLTGVGAGLGGMVLALLLHAIQHFAYGYSVEHVVSSESFLQGVTNTTPVRRLLALTACGLVAGLGWWALYRFGRPLVSIKQAVKSDDPRMPGASTTAHALLQIATVGLGSPLGREVAPREIGAAFAGWLSHRAGLSVSERQIMVACGAGAGVAAVYNVPLGGAVFVLEVLLGTFGWSAVVPAIATSAIAAIVAWIGLGDEQQYRLPDLVLSAPLVMWSILFGPVFGLAAWGFTNLMTRARANAPKDWRLPVFSILNFVIIGMLAMYFPQLPGNGKGPASLSFDSNLTIGLAATLLALKIMVTASSLRAGAQGGLLTPALANGALLAVVLGGLWNYMFPGTPPGAFAIVGAAAFLAASMQMPLTATAVVLELTRVNHDFLVPILLATAGSVSTFALLVRISSVRARSAMAAAPASFASSKPTAEVETG